MSKELSQHELWGAVQAAGGIRAAGRDLGMPESTIRHHLKGYEPPLPDHAFTPDKEDLPETHLSEHGVDVIDYTSKNKVRRFILTSAQNNAEVHQGFLKNLEVLAKKTHAELLVSFVVYDRQGYRGLVHRGGDTKTRDIWWDKAIQPYTMNTRGRLAKRLMFCGELDILATTKNPLSGLDSYCSRSSIIVPHNRFSMKCVESRPHQMPKEMWTTGSVTKSRFIQRKAGQIAHFHHVLGALMVEVTPEGFFYIHQLNAEEDGSFYWLDKRVENKKVKKKNIKGIEAIVLGDIHQEKIDANQYCVAQQLLATMKPQRVFIHDLIDFTSRNHHSRGNIWHKIKHTDQKTVQAELWDAGKLLDELQQVVPKSKIVVVFSNHDAAFAKWVAEADWKQDPANAEFYLETALHMVQRLTFPKMLPPLPWAIKEKYKLAKRVTFLKLDESYEVLGIECGIHGHVGVSGTFGTPKGFSRLGFKTFTAHTHSPSVIDGCYTVGVMGRLQMGYNRGPSKWMHCHGIIYPNGKRALLMIKNDAWCV